MAKIKLKTDRFRKRKGGTARLLDVFCNVCHGRVLLYQKDGTGRLLRCYLDRIFAPPQFEQLQHNSSVLAPQDLPQLSCTACGTVIGTPVRHSSGRLAFLLRQGFFFKKVAQQDSEDFT